ncbi:hypothetical protein AB3S75_015960 [Citrus x aurantiifolia]
MWFSDVPILYLDGIMSILLVLLQNGKQIVQEGVLIALASVADSSQILLMRNQESVPVLITTTAVGCCGTSETKVFDESSSLGSDYLTEILIGQIEVEKVADRKADSESTSSLFQYDFTDSVCN